MDIFWDIQVGPLSMLAIQGVLLPIVFYELFSKFRYLPRYWRMSAKIYIVSLSLGLFWSLVVEPIGGLQTLILNVNIFLAFLIIPVLVNSKKELNQVLIAIMVAGIFPILISLYQFQTGVVFQERQTVGLSRYVGFYHDAFPVRFYGLMTLIALLTYNYTNKLRNIFLKVALVMLTIGALFSIYLVFSKAGVLILGLWIFSLLVFSDSKLKQFFSLFFALAVIFFIVGDAFSANIEQLFSKEVGYQSGEVKDARYTLAGRGYIWQDFWHYWASEQTIFFQWFGDGINRPTHNEYLRVLMANGIIGVLFLVVFIFRKIRKTFKIHKNIRVFAIMLIGMYLIDSIGLVPGVYYYYNILVWGIFGILLMKPQLFLKQSKI
ncbi:O-antigen ligase family protein [Winogradskyella sp.]|uniref:O-antigen ligase family protein n=1 Tax=Winogradskyella sp. TaxID=1883156 RepID=UPI003BAA5EFC